MCRGSPPRGLVGALSLIFIRRPYAKRFTADSSASIRLTLTVHCSAFSPMRGYKARVKLTAITQQKLCFWSFLCRAAANFKLSKSISLFVLLYVCVCDVEYL